jgi:glycosyltransferase involved in cell wall biosynthesis
MRHPKPLLSIVIPTYEMKGQGVTFLKRCINSIEKQSVIYQQQLEVVISDQSHDQAIESFCQNYSLDHSYVLRHHRISTGRGIAAHNLNTAIKLAKGEYVKILFQDDFLVEANYLATIFKTITDKRPECILTRATHTADGVNFFNTLIPANNPYLLFGNNTISSPSVMTASKAILEKIPFDENLKLLFDCDFYYQLYLKNIKIEVIEEISIANGIWDGQTQFAIRPNQFTEEVRYLNWKYPAAKLSHLFPFYKVYFKNLHPEASFPFSRNIKANILKKWLWKFSRSRT